MVASAPYRGYQIVKEYGEKIAKEIIDLWKDGYSIPGIQKYFKEKDNIDLGKGTVDSFVKTAQDPGSANPYKISKRDIEARPNIIGANQFLEQSYENSDKISKRIDKAAQGGKLTITEFLDKNPDLNRTSLFQYLKNTGTSFKKIGQGGATFQQYVTDRVRSLQKLIKKDPNASSNELLRQSELPTDTFNSTLAALKKSYETPRPGFKPNPKLKKTVLNLSDNIPSPFETQIFDDMKKLGINPNLLDQDRLKKVTRSRKALSQFFEETNFEHRLPKQLLNNIDNPNKKLDLLLTGTRTTPELNQFKKRYDNLMGGLVTRLKNNEISLKEYNQQRDQIVNEVKKITGGYEMGYLKFNKAGPDAKATAVVNQKPFYQGTKLAGPEKSQIMSAFENAKFHNNLIKKYKANPNLPAFSGLREYKNADETRLLLDEEKAFNKFKNIVGEQNKQKFLQKASANINSPFIQAIFKSPYGKGAAITTAAITPTALSAEETNLSPIEYGDPDTWNMKVGDYLQTGATVAAAAPLATKKGRSIYGQAAKQILKAAGTPLGLVAANLGFGVDPASGLDRAILGTEAALAPLAVKEAARFGPRVQQIMNLGLTPAMAARFARIASPIGILSLAGEGAYQLYKAGEEQQAIIDAMSPEERENFFAEQEGLALAGEAAEFATGGRVGFDEGGPTDPSKRKFIKRGSGLVGLVVGVLSGVIKVAPEMKQKIVEIAPQVLDKSQAIFLTLQDKIKTFGKLVGDADVDPRVERTYRYKNYELKENAYGDPDQSIITRDFGDPDFAGYGQESMIYKKGGTTEEGIVLPDEIEEVTVRPDGDGKMKDVDFGIEDIDDFGAID